MKWSEEETLKAAENASGLSELLEQKEFYTQRALRWLRDQHIKRFLDAIDAAESKKLEQFAATWHYTDDKSDTQGFPLLDWLWVIGPLYDWQRDHLKFSDKPGAGRMLVACLAEYQPNWISRWWRWRSQEYRFKVELSPIEDAVIKALTSVYR